MIHVSLVSAISVKKRYLVELEFRTAIQSHEFLPVLSNFHDKDSSYW